MTTIVPPMDAPTPGEQALHGVHAGLIERPAPGPPFTGSHPEPPVPAATAWPRSIVFFVKRYRPDIGGVEKYIEELARALLRMGHGVCIVAGDPTGDRPARECIDGVSIYRYSSRRSAPRAWTRLVRLTGLLRRADVVHVSDVEMLERYYRLIGWCVGPRPIALTRHGMSARDPVPLHESLRAERARYWVDVILDDGAFIARRVGVEPDGVPDPGLRPTADAIPYRPEPAVPSAVFIGRLASDSGIDLYLDGLNVLRRTYGITLGLTVYGAGPMEDVLRDRAARAGLPVAWHAPVARAQDRLTDGTFAFVSGRMAIFEAMARRRLVVAAYVDPLKRDYICGEWFSRYIVKASTGAELARQVALYLNDTQRRARRVGRAFEASRHLSWERTAQAYLQIWRQHLMPSQRGRFADGRRPRRSNAGRRHGIHSRFRLWRIAWGLHREHVRNRRTGSGFADSRYVWREHGTDRASGEPGRPGGSSRV